MNSEERRSVSAASRPYSRDKASQRRRGQPSQPEYGQPSHPVKLQEPVVSPLWKTELCNYWFAGTCLKCERCPYAHGEAELRPAPDFERTSVCPIMLKLGKCGRKGCRYAHALSDLRVAPGLLKSKMCSFYMNGLCVVGEACRFAHSPEELETAQAVLANTSTTVVQWHEQDSSSLPPVFEQEQMHSASSSAKLVPIEEASTKVSEIDTSSKQLEPGKSHKETCFEPMKVVILDTWAIDFEEDALTTVSSVLAPVSCAPSSTEMQAKRSRVRRLLIDTCPDLDTDNEDVVASTLLSATPLKSKRSSAPSCLKVPGDSCSMQRPAVVLDIEDAEAIAESFCKGCSKSQSPRIVVEEEPTAQVKATRATARGSCGSTSAFTSAAAKGLPVRSSWNGSACVICCRRWDDASQTPCAACNCGLKVIQHNTFLTIEEDTLEVVSGGKLRKNKSF